MDNQFILDFAQPGDLDLNDEAVTLEILLKLWRNTPEEIVKYCEITTNPSVALFERFPADLAASGLSGNAHFNALEGAILAFPALAWDFAKVTGNVNISGAFIRDNPTLPWDNSVILTKRKDAIDLSWTFGVSPLIAMNPHIPYLQRLRYAWPNSTLMRNLLANETPDIVIMDQMGLIEYASFCEFVMYDDVKVSIVEIIADLTSIPWDLRGLTRCNEIINEYIDNEIFFEELQTTPNKIWDVIRAHPEKRWDYKVRASLGDVEWSELFDLAGPAKTAEIISEFAPGNVLIRYRDILIPEFLAKNKRVTQRFVEECGGKNLQTHMIPWSFAKQNASTFAEYSDDSCEIDLALVDAMPTSARFMTTPGGQRLLLNPQAAVFMAKRRLFARSKRVKTIKRAIPGICKDVARHIESFL